MAPKDRSQLNKTYVKKQVEIKGDKFTVSGDLSFDEHRVLSTKPTTAYKNFSVANDVVENDIVKNALNQLNGQAPLQFVRCSADADPWLIIGVAKNVANGKADIYLTGVIDGFNFGVYVGVEYYIDPANPGKLTWTPPVNTDPIRVGRSLSATKLILSVVRQFVGVKGGIYTSDGNWDDILNPGSAGTFLCSNAGAAMGLQYLAAVVATAPLVYTTSSRALSMAAATASVNGYLTAANFTTFNGKLATNGTFTGTNTGINRPTPVALVDAATIATNAALGNFFTVTLGGNRTLGLPTNPTNGQTVMWRFSQDATGSRTLALNAAFRLNADIVSTVLSVVALKTDYLTAIYNGASSTWDVMEFKKGF